MQSGPGMKHHGGFICQLVHTPHHQGPIFHTLGENHVYPTQICHNFTLLAMFLALFFPLFAASSRVTQKVHSARKPAKTSYKTRYPLGTKYYKERGISNYSASVALWLTLRFAHNSSSNPSTARSYCEGPATRSSLRSSMYSGTGSTAAVVNSLRG